MAKKKPKRVEVFRKVVNICRSRILMVTPGRRVTRRPRHLSSAPTRTMCKEWGRYKVNVNCIAFGLINTRLTQPIEAQQKTDVAGRDIKVGVQPQMLDAMSRMILLGRRYAGRGADAVYLFCSPESNYISGPGRRLRRRSPSI